MKNLIRVALCAVLALAAGLLLSGCMSVTAEELYTLPEASEEFLLLQKEIDNIKGGGAEYSPPGSGMNRQSVQLRDLNGDGRMEALAFFRTSEERPLKLYIFREDNGSYTVASVIEGDGTGFESISYTDMDGDGVTELVIGWQLGGSLQLMTLYSIQNFQPALIANANYSRLELEDLNGDGNTELIALRMSSSHMTGEAECIALMADGEVVSSTAPLSDGVESISRVIFGGLYEGVNALFVDSAYSGGVVTDILVWEDGVRNMSINQQGSVSEHFIRSYAAYCSDINDDGFIDIPYPRELQSQSDTVYRVFDWYTCLSVTRWQFIMTTYYNYSDGWYLILPTDWGGKISIRREDTVSGERAVVFSLVGSGGDSVEDFLKIYTLSGDNKEERARLEGRFIIKSAGINVFAGEILVDADSFDVTLSRELITAGFNMIYSEWNT